MGAVFIHPGRTGINGQYSVCTQEDADERAGASKTFGRDALNAFGSGSVHAAARNMLTRERLDAMIDAKTPEDACKILQDAGYGRDGESIRPDNYPIVLAHETEKLNEFITFVANGNPLFRIFFYPADYHNIKALIKGEILETDASGILDAGGSISVTQMKALIKERNYIPMTRHMKRAVEESIETHARMHDPQLIDLICDRECYSDICDTAADANNDFAIGYVKLLIDTINLRTFARCRRMKQPWSFFSTVFIKGGNIDEKLFITGYEEQLSQFAARLLPYGLQEACEAGAEGLKETGTFTELEKQCDNALITYIRQARFATFGIEPVIAYMVGKQMEIKSVRIILAGKVAQVPAQQLRERVRDTYV